MDKFTAKVSKMRTLILEDNDLDMIRSPDGQLIDAGDGIEVMRHLDRRGLDAIDFKILPLVDER